MSQQTGSEISTVRALLVAPVCFAVKRCYVVNDEMVV
jgi:hypothetical protein